jgi:hypothetical protein
VDDALSGKKLWSFKLADWARASPMSYGIAGRQYFAVAAGDEVVAFGLPQHIAGWFNRREAADGTSYALFGKDAGDRHTKY